MFFGERLRNAALSALPLIILVLILHLAGAPLAGGLGGFVAGGMLIILGLAIFMSGVDLGILPMGQKIGSELASRRSFLFLCGLSLVAGFFMAVTEPNANMITEWAGRNSGLPHIFHLAVVGAGVGLFATIAVCRIVLQISIKKIMVPAYGIIFLVIALVVPEDPGLPLAAGGIISGAMTVPFMLAVGIGMAAVRGGSGAGDDSFGLVGIISLGAAAAAILLDLMGSGVGSYWRPSLLNLTGESSFAHFIRLLPVEFRANGLSILPMLALLIFLGTTLFDMSRLQVIRLTKGVIYAFVGLFLFSWGLRGGVMTAAEPLGAFWVEEGKMPLVFLLSIGFSVLAVFMEPTVWVLKMRAEEVSGGMVSRKHLLLVLALSAACAVFLTLLRASCGISLWCILAPGYVLVLLLIRPCPKMFTGLAFDAGGVLVGPVACTFTLGFIFGVSGVPGAGYTDSAFSLIALLVLMPLIFVQILGILFERKRQLAERRKMGPI